MQCPVAPALANSQSKVSQEPATTPAGRCPFDPAQLQSVVSASQAGENGTQMALPIESQDSPDEVAALNGCPFGYAASEPVKEPSAAAARCPMGHGQQQSQAADTDARQDAAPAQCPMGFTAADGPRMTQLHCVICKSLLYDCVKLSCSCKYCRYCVDNFQDCPLCGADITSRTAETELQGMVDQYIDAHAGIQNLFDMGKSGSQLKAGATSDSRSAFLLQLAVRSAAGGNHPAAIDRLQKCKAELLRQVEGEGHTIALCSKLGAVCGSQGDCHRQLDQPGQAKACYEESVQHLRACNSQDAEVVHPLSVSHNKLGDLEYGLGNVEAAVAQYRQGLSIREHAVQHSQQHGQDPGPGQQLDVAVSIIKVADACQALVQQGEASQLLSRALHLVEQIRRKSQDTPDIAARCQGLLAFLDSRQTHE